VANYLNYLNKTLNNVVITDLNNGIVYLLIRTILGVPVASIKPFEKRPINHSSTFL
jgi:hypothetical protein